MTAVEVKQAELADAADVARVHCEAFTVEGDPLEALLYFPDADFSKRPSDMETFFKTVIEDKSHMFLKAVVDGTVVGYADWKRPTTDPVPLEFYPPGRPSEEEKAAIDTEFMADFKRVCLASRRRHMQGKPFWALELLGVDPAYQRKGVGSALLKWSIAEAAKNGGLPAWVESSPQGEGLYKRNGFKVLGMDEVTSKRLGKRIEWPYLFRETQAA